MPAFAAPQRRPAHAGYEGVDKSNIALVELLVNWLAEMIKERR